MMIPNKTVFVKRTLTWALVWLVSAVSAGLLLRYIFVNNLPFVEHKKVLHAHSHVMFLGWVFNALFALLVWFFIPENRLRLYAKLLILFQLANAGMLVAFAVQGYGLFSIAFSTLHIWTSYALAYLFWKDTRHEKLFSLQWIYAGFFFMLLSSLAPYGLPFAKTNPINSHLLVFAFLHFQYNGWFIFCLIGLFIRYLELQQIPFRASSKFLFFSVAACILGYALSALWVNPPQWVIWIGVVSVILQGISLYYFGLFWYPLLPLLKKNLSKIVWQLLAIVLIAFLIKNFLQITSAYPPLAIFAFQIRNVIIAYLHLVFLGVVSLSLLALFLQENLLPKTAIFQKIVWFWVLAILLQEIWLVGQPMSAFLFKISLPFYYEITFLCAVLLWIGAVALFVASRKPK